MQSLYTVSADIGFIVVGLSGSYLPFEDTSAWETRPGELLRTAQRRAVN